jgi:hypothetical protein
MVVVKYSHRIICDNNFCSWLHKQPNRERILSNLMHIKSSSKDWKKTHNLILKSEADCCSDKIDVKYLGAAFKIIDNPPFLENYSMQQTKNIIFGIELTDEPPFKCYLLTSPDKEEEYNKNKHNQNINNFKVISGDKALEIIQNFYRAFIKARDEQRM